MSAQLSSDSAAALLPALSQQLHRFFHSLDEARYELLLELFTEDCRWLRQGRWLEGKRAVRAALEARPAGSGTRHVMSNVFISRLDGGSAALEAYMTAYRYPIGSAGVPGHARGPLRLSLAPTVFRRDPGHDWRIAEQKLLTVAEFDE